MPNHDPQTGKFVPGNKASPGRTKRVVEVEFHNVLVDAVSADLWLGIVRKAIADALKGDKYARDFIAQYTIGKPPQILELRAADATLLAEVLKRFDERGMPASDVFNAMLMLLAEEEIDGLEVEQDER